MRGGRGRGVCLTTGGSGARAKRFRWAKTICARVREMSIAAKRFLEPRRLLIRGPRGVGDEGEALAGSCVETHCVCPPKQGIVETG
jgi:hypothetical protein